MEHFIGAYKQYVDFSGRANRQKFWMFVLFYMIVYIALLMVDSVIGTGGLLVTVFSLGSLLPAIAITARRLHDINKSGWWQLLALIPLVGIIILIIWYVKEGDKADNRFGADPLKDDAQ